MNTQYENPPLIELIVDLRWQCVQPTTAHGSNFDVPRNMAAPMDTATSQEEFFMRFNHEISITGGPHFQIERMVPQGFPLIPYQLVYRFRETSSDNEWKRLYQLGPGIFSAHALPPNYKSWSQFKPFVQSGVNALIKCRPDNEKKENFSSVILRYLDAYGPDLMGEYTARAFCEQVLGFSVQLPPTIKDKAKNVADVMPSIQLTIPSNNGLTITINLGQIDTNSGRKVLMDTMVATLTEVQENQSDTTNAIMESLEKCHSFTSDIFYKTTNAIQDIMRPLKGLHP
jgi:uncharacterized protein (TIGR04255 family)